MFQINVRSVTYSKRSVGKTEKSKKRNRKILAEEWFTRGLGRVYSVYDPTQASLAFFFSLLRFYSAVYDSAVYYRTVYYRAVYYRTVYYRTVDYRTVYYRAVYYRAVYYRAVYYRANYRTTVTETSEYETRDRLTAAFY